MSDKMAWTAWAIRRVGTDELEKNYWGLFCIFENETDAIDHCKQYATEDDSEGDKIPPEWEAVKVRITTDE
jgi:NADH:ubiquinone oxidoreductase subunit